MPDLTLDLPVTNKTLTDFNQLSEDIQTSIVFMQAQEVTRLVRAYSLNTYPADPHTDKRRNDLPEYFVPAVINFYNTIPLDIRTVLHELSWSSNVPCTQLIRSACCDFLQFEEGHPDRKLRKNTRVWSNRTKEPSTEVYSVSFYDGERAKDGLNGHNNKPKFLKFLHGWLENRNQLTQEKQS